MADRINLFQTTGPTTLMLGGFLLAIPLPYPFNLISLLGGYFGAIALTIVFPVLAEFFMNKDRLLRPNIESTQFAYPRKLYHFWMEKDPMDDPRTFVDTGYFTKRQGYSQVPIVLKEPFYHPRYGKLYKVYIRFRGDWPKRLLHKGCKANRWGAYGLDHKTGDECTLSEIRADKLHPDVPVKESSNYRFPVYRLTRAPGDLRIEEEMEYRRMMDLITPRSKA